MQRSGSGSSGSIVLGGHFVLVVPPSTMSGHGGCSICDGIGHLAKDYSRHVLRAAFILVIRGRGYTIDIRGRGSKARGSSHRAI